MLNSIPTWVLFLTCFTIVSSGWILVPTQVSWFPEEVALFLRFLIGYLFLLVCGLFSKRNVSNKMGLKIHILLFINGFLSFSINYYLCYVAANFIPSGLIVVILSQIILPTMLLERIVFGNKIRLNMILGCILGLVGIFLLTFKDIYKVQLSTLTELSAIFLALLSTLFSSVGYILIKKLTQKGLGSLNICKYSMGYSVISNFLLCIYFKDYSYTYEFSLQHIVGFLYLGIFVSAIAFVLFFELVKRGGATKASYLWTITPAGAIVLSSLFEHYQLTIASSIGIFLTLCGGMVFRLNNLTYKKEQLSCLLKQKFQSSATN